MYIHIHMYKLLLVCDLSTSMLKRVSPPSNHNCFYFCYNFYSFIRRLLCFRSGVVQVQSSVQQSEAVSREQN